MTNPKGLPVLVDVYAQSETPPGQYRIDWRFQGGQSQGNTPILLPKGSGEHDMVFTLHNEDGVPLRFKEFASDAMWVHPGTGCPTGKGSGKGHVTFGNVSQPDRLTLTVNDDNKGAACTLSYMLRFDPDPYVFDPEIRNGGGGGISRQIALTVGTAVIGAAAAIGLNSTAGVSTIALWAVVGGIAGFVADLVLGKMQG